MTWLIVNAVPTTMVWNWSEDLQLEPNLRKEVVKTEKVYQKLGLVIKFSSPDEILLITLALKKKKLFNWRKSTAVPDSLKSYQSPDDQTLRVCLWPLLNRKIMGIDLIILKTRNWCYDNSLHLNFIVRCRLERICSYVCTRIQISFL